MAKPTLVVAIAGLKGGVGKSTLAVNLATCLHEAEHRVLLVDADSQGTLQSWALRAEQQGHSNPPVVPMKARQLIRRHLPSVTNDFAIAIVDTPARLGAEARAAMVASDLVLLPVVPGAPDVWALAQTVELFAQARELRPELRGAVVLNQAEPRTRLSAMAQQALAKAQLPVLDAILCHRVAYGEATLAGLGVVQFAPRSAAAHETRALTRAVLEVLEE